MDKAMEDQDMEMDTVIVEDGSGDEDDADVDMGAKTDADPKAAAAASTGAMTDEGDGDADGETKGEGSGASGAHHGFTESAQAAIDKAEDIKAQFDERAREKDLVLPTRDDHVKKRLRELEQPICLFGEIAGDRRDRLKKILLQMGITHGLPAEAMPQIVDSVPETLEAFLTEGTPDLRRARVAIAHGSLLRAQRRLREARERLNSEMLQKEEDVILDTSLDKAKRLVSHSSEVGSDRPLTCVAFNNYTPGAGGGKGQLRVAIGSWKGTMSLWSVPDCVKLLEFDGHEHRVCGLDFHPLSGVSQSDSEVQLASASVDKSVLLWSLDKSAPVARLLGHADRVNKVVFHPFGRHLVSASFDRTWRLWDVETRQELLLQEGHSKSIYAAAFQGDGSLIATGGLDSRVVVWDLRSGRSLWTVSSHSKPILGIDWSPNGYLMASGSEDHACKLTDVRMRRTLYTIPAHGSLVSGVKFEPDLGACLVTSSFDGLVNVWDAVSQVHPLIKSLAGHDGRVMSVDVCHGGQYIASAGYDRTFKLFAVE